VKLPLHAIERRWVRAIFVALFTDEIAVPGDPADFLDQGLARSPLEPSVGIRLTVWMCALAPLFVLKRFATIASLDVADRVRVLEALGKNRVYAVRQLVLGLKAMLALHFAHDPQIRARLTAVPAIAQPAASLRRAKPLAKTAATPEARGAHNDNAA
jgi:hypothetical protein